MGKCERNSATHLDVPSETQFAKVLDCEGPFLSKVNDLAVQGEFFFVDFERAHQLRNDRRELTHSGIEAC